VAGGIGGVLVARELIAYGVAAAVSGFGAIPRTSQVDLRMDMPALAVALGATVLAVTVSAFLPAVRLTRRSIEGRPLGELSGGLRTHWRGQRGLLSFQVAASLGLLLMTAVCEHQVLAIARARDLNIDLARLAVVTAEFSLRTHDDTWVLETSARIMAEAPRQPAIDSMAVTNGLPSLERNPNEGLPVLRATGGIFRVLGLPMRGGRAFVDGEPGAVGVVSESVAIAAFGTPDVVGRDMILPSRTSVVGVDRFRIVGVVADAGRDQVTHQGLRQVYLPYVVFHDGRTVTPPVWLLARSAGGDARGTAATLRAVIRRIDPNLPVGFSGRADFLANGAGELLRFVARLLGCLAVMTLVLSASGLYAVTSQLVVNRTREMGIRMALGADAHAIVRLILRDAVRPVVTGLVIGLSVAALVKIVMPPPLGGHLAWLDGLFVVIALIPLLAATGLACYLPARRAAGVDPNDALHPA
jgi:hypothetical protein